jgi:hypothetical protein
MNKAESTEDVRNAFVQTVEALLNGVLDGRVRVQSEDLLLLPDTEPHYRVSGGLRSDALLKSYWKDSDLPRVIHRLAESASGRHKHLEKHPERTELKIRM